MPRYTLKKGCCFVDLITEEGRKEQSNSGTPCPFIIDKRGTADQFKEYPLNDGAAFILRFLLVGLDSDLLSQALMSAYMVSPAEAEMEIHNLIDSLLTLNLLEMDSRILPVLRAQVQRARRFTGISLNNRCDVRLNQFGSSGVKLYGGMPMAGPHGGGDDPRKD